jgi:hypothetical protein
MQTMRSRYLLHLAESPGGKQYFIAGLFESPDKRREELGMGRIIQVDPDAHFASR